MSKETKQPTENTTTEEELKKVKEVLGTLIVWLYSELGESNVKTLLEKLNK